MYTQCINILEKKPLDYKWGADKTDVAITYDIFYVSFSVDYRTKKNGWLRSRAWLKWYIVLIKSHKDDQTNR